MAASDLVIEIVDAWVRDNPPPPTGGSLVEGVAWLLMRQHKWEEAWMAAVPRTMNERIWADAWHVQGDRAPDWHYEVFQLPATTTVLCAAHKDLRCSLRGAVAVVATRNDAAHGRCTLMPLCSHHFDLWAQKARPEAGAPALIEKGAPAAARWEPVLGTPVQQYVLGMDDPKDPRWGSGGESSGA